MKHLAMFEAVRSAGRQLELFSDEAVKSLLLDLADITDSRIDFILQENAKDLDRMDVNNPKYDRLKLTESRLKGIADDMRKVACLESPVGRILSEKVLSNGLNLQKVSVPIGVIGIIYEARPNVTFDVFSLCIKSGNACVLKGGSDADFSNKAIISIIKECLQKHQFPVDAATLLPSDREATAEMLTARDYIDLIIPRGSKGLIDFVRENSKIPTIETGAGIVHTYFDSEGDKQLGQTVILNAKTRRVSVCNALDCLIIHQSRLGDLPFLVQPMADKNVIIYADTQAYQALQGQYPVALLQTASTESFGTEFIDYKMAIKTVSSFEEALAHIEKYGSKHSEAIITSNVDTSEAFLKCVDAAVVYVNTSTAFTDGGQFNLGAEIGISTQKLHARGPMALAELCIYKWMVRGNGQIRPS